MRIAIPYEDGAVFQHFGHSQRFKVYDTEDGTISGEQVVDATGSGHGALAGFLSDLQVDTLICGGIGAGAQTALAQVGIKLYNGVTGQADDAAAALLAGTLQYDPDAHCVHHDHARHEHGHCGKDKHGCTGNGGKCGG